MASSDGSFSRSHRLERLLNPRSIALIGASDRNRYCGLAMQGLEQIGFDGALHLVNRRGGVAFGRPCALDCRSLGGEVDAAYLVVPYEAVLDAAQEALEAGIRNLVVISSGFAELDAAGARREAELKALCDSAGAKLLGPNCLGFRNMLDRVALGSIPFVPQAGAGSVALVCASGSVANTIAMYGVQQGVDFTHVVATGNEMNVSSADLVDYLVEIEPVRAVALFLETVKDASMLGAAAERARRLAKPIVVFKVGATPATAAIAAAHTSAIVGDDKVFDAACNRLGIVRVDTIEDLVVTAGLIASVGPVARTGVGLVSMSGGVCEIASDLAPGLGAELPRFADATHRELGEVLSEFTQIHNPIDLTGMAVRDETLWRSVPRIVSGDPSIGLTLVNWDVPDVAEPRMANTLALIGETLAAASTPMALVTNLERPVNQHGRAYLRRHRIGFALPGLRHGLVAAGRLAWWSQRLQQAEPEPWPKAPAAGSRPAHELETLAHLARHGVPVVPTRLVRSAAEAVRAAADLGGAAALKVCSPDIAHKSDIGGVVLGLQGDAAGPAFDRMMANIAAKAPDARIEGVIVAPMRSGGLELLVGAARDPQWGAVLAIGLGGVWTEVLADSALLLVPVGPEEVTRALRSLRGARVLDGYRGAPPVDLPALGATIVAIGQAALALGSDLEALEVNPLYVRGSRIEALDALATWRDGTHGKATVR